MCDRTCRREPGTPLPRFLRGSRGCARRPQARRIGSKDRDASTRSASSADVAATVRCTVPRPPSGRVHDLQVLDVHVVLREDGRELRQRAGSVGGLHLQHGHAGADLRLGRQAQPCLLRAVERALHVARPALQDHRAEIQPAVPCTARSPRRSASRFESRIWLHSAGFDDASRVRSRKPPAASSRMSGSSASSVAARPIKAVDATCGRWLTNATKRSWRAGDIRTGRPPIRAIHASSVATASGSASSSGVSTHTMPSTTDAEACSGPDRSDPPIGCRRRSAGRRRRPGPQLRGPRAP